MFDKLTSDDIGILFIFAIWLNGLVLWLVVL